MSGSSGLEGMTPEFVRKAQAGDEAALRTLASHAYPLVRRWALVRTGDPADADDLTQDVLVQMIRRLGTYRGTASFGTWLYAVTRNAAADHHRREARRVRRAESPHAGAEFIADRGESPDAGVDRVRLAALLRVFFEELPGRQREVFDLADLQGFSSPEIAGMLDIEPVSVRAHLFKARRALRLRILRAHPHLLGDFR